VPQIVFNPVVGITADQVAARIAAILGPDRPADVSMSDREISFVDLPDATPAEATAVENDLRATFPLATAGEREPHPILLISPAAAAIQWTNMPAAATEFLGLTIHRHGASLQKIEEVRLIVNVIVAGVAGSGLRAQYSQDNVTFNPFVAPNDPQVIIDSVGMKRSAWFALPIDAKKDAVIRIIGGGGNGVVDPQFGSIIVEGR
jgi:hypothetical protein